MSKAAALPLFADAYLADTMHLSTEEHGAYLLLLMAAWRQEDCGLPNDDRKLARIAGLSVRKWTAMRGTILEFWATENGRIYQARLSKERSYVRQKSKSNSENADKRWHKQPAENKANRGMPAQCERNAPPPPPKDVFEPKGSHTSQSAGRAIRIPANWSPRPLPANVAELTAQWPPGREKRELEGFRDYWTARKRDAARLDWDLTWHNRIRDIHDRVLRDARHEQRQHSSPPNGIAAALDRRIGSVGAPGEAVGRADRDGEGDRGAPVARLALLR